MKRGSTLFLKLAVIFIGIPVLGSVLLFVASDSECSI